MWTTPLFIVMAIAIVTGNVITMVIFTTSRRLRKRGYVLIANLAVADFFVGLISVPMYVYMIIKGGTYKNISITFRRVYTTEDALFGAASLYALAALAVERAYATYFPFKYPALSRTQYTIGIAAGWLSALLFSGLVLFRNARGLRVIQITALVIAPLVIVVTAYVLIWIKMTCAKPPGHHAIQNSNRKLTISLTIISLVTLVAWIPFMVVQVEYMFCYDLISSCNRILYSYEFAMACKWLQYGNSVVNVIVYSLRMREFRKELLRKLRCCPRPPLGQANERIELQNVIHNV